MLRIISVSVRRLDRLRVVLDQVDLVSCLLLLRRCRSQVQVLVLLVLLVLWILLVQILVQILVLLVLV